MNIPPSASAEPLSAPVVNAPPSVTLTRPLYWSIRREVWENRSLYIAPLIVAAIVSFGFLLSSARLLRSMRLALALDPAHQRAALVEPYNAVAFLFIATAFIVGVFYCLDALHGERRDRSILFWKSLPVSDLIAVLAKASIPLVVLPLLTFEIIVATQLLLLLLSSAVLLSNGLGASPLWTQFQFWQSSLALLYGLVTLSLWHAPLYGWLLLVSAWAQRAVFLWALLPPLGICIVEKIVLNSSHFASLMQYRLIGWFSQAFLYPAPNVGTPLNRVAAQLTPFKYLTTPGLWVGLAVTALFLAGAARLRRSRGPI